MNKRILITIIMLIIFLNLIFVPNAYAKTASEIIQDGDDFLSSGGSAIQLNEAKLKSTSSTVYKILKAIGICVTVIVGAVLGFQFILASAEGKAKIMETLVPYIVGCAVVFGAFGIWSFVVDTGNSSRGEHVYEAVITYPTLTDGRIYYIYL